MGYLWARIRTVALVERAGDQVVGVLLTALKDLCVEAVQDGDAVARTSGHLSGVYS